MRASSWSCLNLADSRDIDRLLKDMLLSDALVRLDT